RQFSPESQRSLGDLQAVEITAQYAPFAPLANGVGAVAQTHNEEVAARLVPFVKPSSGRKPRPSPLAPLPPGERGERLRGHLCDYLPTQSWTMLVEAGDLEEQGKHYLERVADITGLFSVAGVFQQLVAFPSIKVSSMPLDSMEQTCHLRVESVERFSGDVTKVRDELDSAAAGDFVMIACHNEAERKRLGVVLSAGRLAQNGRLQLVVGHAHAGFRLVLGAPPAPALPAPLPKGARGDICGLVVLGDHELFRREQAPSVLPRRRLESRAIDSFLELQEDELVVHLSHGIARYRGMHLLDKDGLTEEHLILEFAGGTRVYVPASKIDLVQKYVGGAKS